MIRLTYFVNAHSREPGELLEAESWDALIASIEHEMTDCGDACTGTKCPEKSTHGAWSPAAFIDNARKNDNVLTVQVAVFDLDHLDERLPWVQSCVAGYTSLLMSTHTRGSYRLIMPLSRPLSASEWRRFFPRAVESLGLKQLADEACKDPARLYYAPTCPKGREPERYQTVGRDLDVDETLGLPRSEQSDEPVVTNLDDLRGRLVKRRRTLATALTDEKTNERRAWLDAILGGTALAAPGARDRTLNAVAGYLAWLPEQPSVDALIELVRPSIGAMDCEPEGVAHWVDEFRDQVNRARRRREEQLAREAVEGRTTERAFEKFLARIEGRGAVEPEEALPEEEMPKWSELLLVTEKGIKSCGENLRRILLAHPKTRGTLRMNLLTHKVEVHGGPFAGTHPDDLPTAVIDWLQREFKMMLGDREVRARIVMVARGDSYDPIQDYLRAIVWDGVPRLDQWLQRYCGANTTDADGRDIAEHVQRVGRKWLIAAVARALRPGCQVDTVLILEGPQGCGKTSALNVLGGKWHTEATISLGDKDAKMQLAANWIVEQAELASFKRSETESIKAYLSARVDEFRAPYGTEMLKHPRRCIFAGTVNPESGYLVDRTGNRRFWVVACGEVDLDALARDRDQLWAEAVVAFEAGERWWLDKTEQKEADVQASAREMDDPMEGRILSWWYSKSRRAEHVQTHEVAAALDLDPVRYASTIGSALLRVGFTKRRISLHGRQVWVYFPTQEMRDAPQGGAPNPLRLVAQSRTEKKSGQGGNS